MKEKSIIKIPFKEWDKIVKGEKTQIRRIVDNQPTHSKNSKVFQRCMGGEWFIIEPNPEEKGIKTLGFCPYGDVGDELIISCNDNEDQTAKVLITHVRVETVGDMSIRDGQTEGWVSKTLDKEFLNESLTMREALYLGMDECWDDGLDDDRATNEDYDSLANPWIWVIEFQYMAGD